MLKPTVRSAFVAALSLPLLATPALADTAPSPYAGEQTRAVKSLSIQDIDDLRNGRGWGLAKAAELNGVPGPSHLLELADEIGLSETQVTALTEIKADMAARAAILGEALIELETELDRKFADGTINEDGLRDLLARIGETYSELRYVHLSTHFKTPPLLSEAQISAYNRLRGYTAAAASQTGGHLGHGGHR